MKKKNLLIVLFVSISLSVFAQKKNVQNAIDAMKDDNIEEAIKYIELAASNPSSSDYYKTHDKEVKFISKYILMMSISSLIRWLH